MWKITEQLFENKDDAYGDFQAKLTPGIPREEMIGVRVPILRTIAKAYIKDAECEEFLKELPHKYYDETMLHGILLSGMKEYDACVEAVERFLPYVNNWAVCDIMSPKIFKKHKPELLEKIKVWIKSKETYTCRFGMEMLMSFYLDDDFKPEYLEYPAAVRSEEYYVNMMTAWFFATALAKQWDATVKYLEEERLDVWTHNKTIQKARESYRITDEQKAYLKSLKR